ncbi:MAG TPA: serine/threonine-protein kinase [Planctomycetota bacterium]|nr:serine/threonine-protein kinase [Planctomycetota bacterium]
MSDANAKPPGPEQGLPDLSKCELVQELGTTTEGPTLVVRDAATGRRFVLKIYDKSLLRDGEFAARVRRDAQLASGLVHPNVVRVFGAAEWLGDLVVVRDYVEGASLAEVLATKGKLGATETLSVALAATLALERGRQVGLTHEAVSPTNLLVARDGSVKLADLGVAKLRPVEPSISKTGVAVRSPAYLPPEYFELRGSLDTRSDLFSLGTVLYQCLSGQTPFKGDTTAEVTFAVRNGIFRPLREAAPEVSRSFANIIEKLLQSRPADRYENPMALLADLEAVRAGRVPEAQRKAVAEAIREKQEAERQAAAAPAPAVAAAAAPAPAPPRPHRTWAATAAIVLVLAATAAFIVFGPRGKPPARKGVGESIEAPVPVEDPAARARKAREELERVSKASEQGKALEPADKLAAVQAEMNQLQEIEKTYAGTEAAAEAQKRLRPLQAEAAFQSALLYAREHPADREGIAARLREIVEKYRDTAAGYSAERRLDEFEDIARKKAQALFDQARQRARDLAGKRRFGEALAQFDELLAANPPEAIKQNVLLEKNAITSEAERAYLDVQRRAQEKIAGNYYEEAKTLYDQVVATFGVEPFVGRAKSEIAIITPLLKSAAARRLEAIDAAKYQFFLTRLEPSLAQARTWELAAATAEAEKLRAELRTAGIENYLDAYLGDLALLSSLKARVVRRLGDAASPVAVRDFSLGKLGGKFDPQWLEARVVQADDATVVFRYGELDVRRTWSQFAPDELYKLGILATDRNDPQAHLALGVHCLYANLPTVAARELHLAKPGAPDAAASYLQRVDVLLGMEKAAPAAGPQEEASRLLLEAKRYMNEQAWDRALYRLATLREKHASKVYDISANLDDINQRIAQCKKQVEKLEIEANLALGREVTPLRESLFDDWQQRFGKWALEKGVLTCDNPEEHDAECLFSLRHPPAYELRASVRVVEGTGALLRLAGKARPNLAFWVHAGKPDLVGLTMAQPEDQQADERRTQPFAFKPGEWYEIRATVSPMNVQVTIGDAYAVRMPNKLPADPSGLQTYGFVVNPKSRAEFRDFAVRALREQ